MSDHGFGETPHVWQWARYESTRRAALSKMQPKIKRAYLSLRDRLSREVVMMASCVTRASFS